VLAIASTSANQCSVQVRKLSPAIEHTDLLSYISAVILAFSHPW